MGVVNKKLDFNLRARIQFVKSYKKVKTIFKIMQKCKQRE